MSEMTEKLWDDKLGDKLASQLVCDNCGQRNKDGSPSFYGIYDGVINFRCDDCSWEWAIEYHEVDKNGELR